MGATLEAPHLCPGRDRHAVRAILVVRLVMKRQQLAAAICAAGAIVRHPAGRRTPSLLLLIQLDLLLLDRLVLQGTRRFGLVKHGQVLQPGLDRAPPKQKYIRRELIYYIH